MWGGALLNLRGGINQVYGGKHRFTERFIDTRITKKGDRGVQT